jgi:hypothetical protein
VRRSIFAPALILHRVKVAVRQPVIDSKGVKNRRNRQSRNTRRNLLPNCYQNMQVGSGLNRGGSAPSVSHLNNLIFSNPGVSQSMTTSAFWRHYFRFAVIHLEWTPILRQPVKP